MDLPFPEPDQSKPLPPLGRGTSYPTWLSADLSDHAALARRRLNHWLECWDFGDRDELTARLKSGDDDQFRGAFWELFLNAMFRSLGYSVARDPLSAGGVQRTPDFLVSRAGCEFFVEATSVGRSRADARFEALRDQLADILDRQERHDFAISLMITSEGATTPSGRRLGAAICRWLDSLEVSRVREMASGGDLVEASFEESGWTFEVTVIPLSPGSDAVPMVGLLGASRGGALTDTADLRAALNAKRPSGYGPLDRPYLIAVLERAFMPRRASWHRVAALFGDESIILRPDGESRSTRARNGTWLGPSGLRRHDVSGVLLLGQMELSGDVLALPEYWPHPSASRPVDRECLPLAGMDLAGTALQARAGLTSWDGFVT